MAGGGLDFNDFLSEMTGTPKAAAPVQQERRPQPKKPALPPVQEDLEDEDWEEQVEDDVEEEEVEDIRDDSNSLDVVGRSLEYSSIVLKTIRQTFSQKDQSKVLETLRSSIDAVLGESNYAPAPVYRQEPTMRQRPVQQESRAQAPRAASPMMAAPTLSEDVYNRMTPEQLEAYERGTYDPFQGQQQQAPAQPRAQQRQQTTSPKARVDESRNRSYDKNLDLGLKLGADGKPEVDLSNVSEQDIADMKILMGL